MRHLVLALTLLVWWCASAAAQSWPEVCLPGSDNGGALSLRVDAQSEIHLFRIALVSGDLLYSKKTYGGEVTNERVARRISRLAGEQVTQTDLQIRGAIPQGCFRDVRSGSLKYVWRDEQGWNTEVVAEGPGLGSACGLFWVDDGLLVAYQSSQGLGLASRGRDGGWATEVLFEQPGAGAAISVASFSDGTVYVVHRQDPEGLLLMTHRGREGAWDTEAVPFAFPAGESLRAVAVAGGRVMVAHGIRGDAASDAGLVITHGAPGRYESLVIGDEYIGGSIGATRMFGQQLGVLSRELRRSAVFGDFDGLRLYDGLPAFLEFDYLAQHDSGGVRRRYLNLDLQSDPFGFPVGAYVAERAPSQDDRGGAPVCIRRAVDADADRLPDQVEMWLGSDPLSADTDQDGVSDGEAALMGLHPVHGGPLPEGILLGPPDGPAFQPPRELDGGLESDAEVVDAGVPDAMPPADSSAREDVLALADVSRGVDMARPIGRVPVEDSGSRVGAAPESGVADGEAFRPVLDRGASLAEGAADAASEGCNQLSNGRSPHFFLAFLVLWAARGRRNGTVKSSD